MKHIHSQTGKFECSFASKLVASINPELPIRDLYILNNLGIKKPSYKKQNINNLTEIYSQIKKWYNNFLQTEQANTIINIFDDIYGKNEIITNTKKIDFLLWQMR